MVEPDKAAFRLLGEIGIGRNLGDEDHEPAQIHIGALDAIRHHRFDDLGAEHALIICRGLIRVWAAQMDVVVAEFGHRGLPELAISQE